MGIKSIRIKNLLSFDDVYISEFKDINCIIGQNNTGKSNLLALMRYFFIKLDDGQEIPPKLNSEYNTYGSITIVFDTTKIKQVVTSKQDNPYLKHIYNVFFNDEPKGSGRGFPGFFPKRNRELLSSFELTLTINKNDSTGWSNNNKEVREILNRVFPFFYIDTRKIDLYDWGKLWGLVSQLKFFNTNGLRNDEIVDFFDEKISEKSNSYRDSIKKIEKITSRTAYSYQEKIINYVKVGLDGHSFNIDGEELILQSDGTNSHKYLELFINLMIALTRREFITPTLFVDEPEIGLHPKRNEELIYKLYEIYSSFKKTSEKWEVGKYQTPNPNIIFSTHSPNIVKSIIKSFQNDNEHQVLHFSKNSKQATTIRKMNTYYEDKRFLNIFSDNEARLFFSSFILFVEGETEIELFSNLKLANKFPDLRKIDIYKANDLMLKPIHPSFSNLAIPYLVLFDADLLLETNFTDGSLNFINDKVNLFELSKKYKRSFGRSKEHYLNRDIKKVLIQNKLPKTLTANKIDYSLFKYDTFLKTINKNVLMKLNIMAAATTIEGSLINSNSIHIFYRWLIHESLNNLSVGGKGDISKKLISMKKLFNLGNRLSQVFSGVFGFPPTQQRLSESELHFSKKVKIKYLKSVRDDFISSGFTHEEFVIIFRLVLGGKTNTLVSINNVKAQHLDPSVIGLVSKIKQTYFRQFPHQLTKTGGWVTSFINFSIDYIENVKCKKTGNSFNEEFSITFPELFDIINKVSFSIE
jgi:predicted ATP-dependent endonuclease of OLD family